MTGYRGVYAVSSLDRLEDLRRMVTSLWRKNRVQVQVMLAKDWEEAQFMKARVGKLSAFRNTVMLDTDVLVKGRIDPLFEIAEAGKIGLYKELRGGPWNTGVMALNRDVGEGLSDRWESELQRTVNRFPRSSGLRSYMVTDQAALNRLMDGLPVHRLGGEWNYIIQERSIEDEARDWDDVMIHHFIHKGTVSRKACMAYSEWMML